MRYLNVYKCIERVINCCGSDLEVCVVKDSGGDRKGKRGRQSATRDIPLKLVYRLVINLIYGFERV